VIVADEPTSALDFDGQAEVAEILTGLGVTALVISHEQVLVDRCDRVVEMAQGRLREVR
jgi:zinc transport system ATP-binding protein